MAENILSPKRIATEAFTDESAAVARLAEIYERNTGFLRDRFEAYCGEPPKTHVRATYPFVRSSPKLTPGSTRASPTASCPAPACTRQR